MGIKIAREVFCHIKHLVLISNIIFTLCPMVINYLFPREGHQIIMYFNRSSVIGYGVAYDAFYYLTVDYEWESNYVFLPGFIYTLKIFRFLLGLIFSKTDIPLVIAGIIFNKILNVFSAIFIYQIAQKYRIDNYDLPYYSALIFLFNPASIFFNSVYTEPLFCFITFLAIKKGLDNIQISNDLVAQPIQYIRTNLTSILLMSASTIVRSMGIFYSAFYGIPLLVSLFFSLKKRNILESLKIIVTGIIVFFIIVTPYLTYLTNAYFQFCNNQMKIKAQFCSDTIPNIYSHSQLVFFDVGFLKYYQGKPVIWVFYGTLSIFIGFLTLILSRRLHNNYYKIGIVLTLLINSFISLLIANILPATRFLCSNPLFHIIIAYYLRRQQHKKFRFLQLAMILYLWFFNICGILLLPTTVGWM